eukprot:CAMPEP_0114987698 /NCGR_PEP_ID=MMETSP0216-20121206/9162_1 /TAXON_ID=223996 /ORGANISM="Protocruzia adherens, Strain Boccale" /LENGTH=352 /DNA_ID=CAMNT_0002350345 /DNA_START=729 /DNA_END=1788 /DNA_ORIENTATION=+
MALGSLVAYWNTFFLTKVANLRYDIPSFQIVTVRGTVMLVVNSIKIYYSDASLDIPRRFYKNLFWRAFAGVISSCLIFYSATVLKFGECLTIFWTLPFLSVILAAIFLDERLNLFDLLAIMMSFIGVLLVFQPEYLFSVSSNEKKRAENSQGAIHPVTYLLPFIAAIFAAIANVQMRVMKNHVHYAVPILFLSVALSSVPPVIAMLFQGFQILTTEGYVITFAAGIVGWIGQLLQSKSLQIEKLGTSFCDIGNALEIESPKTPSIPILNICGIGSAVGFIQVALGFLADVFVFHNPIGGIEIIGAFFIFLGLITLIVSQFEKKADLAKPKFTELPHTSKTLGDEESDEEEDL